MKSLDILDDNRLIDTIYVLKKTNNLDTLGDWLDNEGYEFEMIESDDWGLFTDTDNGRYYIKETE